MSESPIAPIPKKLARFFQWSTAAYASMMLGLALIGMTAIVWSIYNADAQRVAWGDYLGWQHLFVLFAIWLCVCLSAYWTIRLWNDDYPAHEQELESAWQSGLASLAELGIPFTSKPLFVVFGCEDESTQRRFMDQSKSALLVEPVPAVSAPIKWYITEDRIVLFCRNVGTYTTSLNRLSLHSEPHSNHPLAQFLNTQSLVSKTWLPEQSAKSIVSKRDKAEAEQEAYHESGDDAWSEFGSNRNPQAPIPASYSSTSQHPFVATLAPAKSTGPIGLSPSRPTPTSAREALERLDEAQHWLNEVSKNRPIQSILTTRTFRRSIARRIS